MKAIKGKNVILDTTIIIKQLNGDIDLSTELSLTQRLFISALTQAELYAGVDQSQLLDLQAYIEDPENPESRFYVLPVTSAIATLGGAYKASFSEKSLKDMIIAATAQLHKLILITDQKAEFEDMSTISKVFIE